MGLIACVSTVDDDKVTTFVWYDVSDDAMVEMLSDWFTQLCIELCDIVS